MSLPLPNSAPEHPHIAVEEKGGRLLFHYRTHTTPRCRMGTHDSLLHPVAAELVAGHPREVDLVVVSELRAEAARALRRPIPIGGVSMA